MTKAKSQQSLSNWTKQKWGTKSGKPRAKREGTKAGKQHVAQPKGSAKKTKRFRAARGGVVI